MAGDLRIDGRQVAEVDLRSRYGDFDHVVVFRAPASWTVLTIDRTERYGDDGSLVRAVAVVSCAELADLVALREFCERSDCWREVLDAGHGEDPELYEAWVPHRVDDDLHASSIYNRDLALATAYLGGQPVSSPARALAGWEAEACAAMAVNLDERGWQVRRALTPAPGASQPGDNVVVGALEAWRYGWAVAVVVRVDYCGEVYARRADDDEVAGVRVLRKLSDDEEDQADVEYQRRRHARPPAGPSPDHHVESPGRRRRAAGR